MLHLLQLPRWSAPGAEHDLPATLPGWIVAFLALQDGWVSRDRLLALFWPDAGSAEAQHNLRVNLHRTRQLLASWGVGDGLQSERRRVRLALPSDVAALRAALAAGDGAQALALAGRPLLDGMAFAGFAAFQEWVELERAELHARWREAALGELAAAAPARALDIARRLLAADGLDEQAVAAQLAALAALGRDGDAARAWAAYRQRLHDAVGAEPSAALTAPPRPADDGGVRAPASGAASRDAFVGRDVELAQLQAMLRQPGVRLVTLVGAGGVGKSRLARELCTLLAPQFGAVHWVALGTVADGDGALLRLAAQLGVAAPAGAALAPALAKKLAGSARLLVFDDGEHVAALGGRLAALLDAAPDVRCLVTSRVPLAAAHEQTYALEGLALPPADGSGGADEVRACEALRLLETRARARAAGFDLGAQLDACAALVRRVGGWPLAIEIAASLLAEQPAAALLADLELTLDTLAVATAPQQARHDSVRASLQLSWQLLTPAQQQALAALAVFDGGFTRASALAVTGAEGPVLAALVERLLVQAEGGGRFGLHPLVAQFAAERLAQGQGGHDARRHHAEHFMQRLGALGDGAQADASAAANAIEADFDNFRAAWLRTAAQHGAAAVAPAARAWTNFCNAKGRARDVAALVEAALAEARADGAARANLLLALTNARYRGGDIDAAIALAHEARAAADAAGDGACGRSASNLLALALLQRGLGDEAGRHAHDALQSARSAGADEEVATIANTCAIAAKARGDLQSAAALYEEAMAIHRRRGNLRGLALCLNNLGNVHRARDDLGAAQGCFEECLRLCDQHGIASTRAYALGNLGLVAYQSGRLDAALQYAERTLAEPAVEPPMTLGALAVQARVAIDRGRLADAAPLVRRLTQQARAIGLHGALNEAIMCHARLLRALGERAAAAARLQFVAGHPQATAQERSAALALCDALGLDDGECAQAAHDARALDFDVLLEAAARAGAA